MSAKLSAAQERVLQTLREGVVLRLWPYMGWFDSGGYRWEMGGQRRNPNPATVEKLLELGLVEEKAEASMYPRNRTIVLPAPVAPSEEESDD